MATKKIQKRNADKVVVRPLANEPHPTAYVRLEVQGEPELLRGRYANHIQVSVQEEEFILDFFARSAEQTFHVSRMFISPRHALRLNKLLEKQIETYRSNFPNSPLKEK
jgi:hypothetical protein